MFMKSSLLRSVLLSSVIFSGLTVPLAALGSNSVNIEVQKENIFVGKLKDVATPYLGFAGFISIGVGAVSISIAEWRRASRQSNQVESHLLELKKELKEKSERIDELCLSEHHLSATGLHSFLELNQPELSPVETQTTAQIAETVVQGKAATVQQDVAVAQLTIEETVPESASTVASIASSIATLKSLLAAIQAEKLESASINQSSIQPAPEVPQSIYPEAVESHAVQSQVLHNQPVHNASTHSQPANHKAAYSRATHSQPIHRQPIRQQFAYAQPNYSAHSRRTGYSAPNGHGELSLVQPSDFEIAQSRFLADYREPLANPSDVVLSQVNELQNQLLQIASNVEALQNSFQPSVQQEQMVETNEGYSSEIDQIYRRLQLLELDWMRHQIAS